MSNSNFSNQAYVDDSPRDRMVLSQFGYEEEFGYGAFSYGDAESFEFGTQVNQLTAPGVVTTKEAEILRSMKNYHNYLHAHEHAHPMSGFEGLWDTIKSTVTGEAKKALSSATTAASTSLQRSIDATASQVKSGTSAIIGSTATTAKQAVSTTTAPKPTTTLQKIAAPVQQVVTKTVEVVKENKLPIAAIGLGALALYYFYFMRRK